MRVDRDDKKTQVFCVVHTRELCNQVCAVYEKLTKGTGITLSNFAENDKDPGQIVVTTHGKADKVTSGRKTIDLSHLKCFVIDEADVFFMDEKNYQTLMNIYHTRQIKSNKSIQWILFSATYPPELDSRNEIV